MRATKLGGDRQRAQSGSAQVPIEHTGAAVADHVERPRHGQCRHREATGERFQQNETEGFGPARQDEDIGRRIVSNQRFALLATGKAYLRITTHHCRQQMPVADHQLGARQIKIEEGRQRFFRSHPSDVEEYRPRQIESGSAARPE
jgi:hypothetical protein